MKRINWFLVVGILLGVSLLVAAVSLYLVQQQRIDAQHGRIVSDSQANDELQQQYQGLVGQYTQAYGQLEASGVKPTTAPPSTLPSSPGAPGERGTDGAAGSDGRGVVFALCTATGWAVTYTDGDTENAGDCVGSTGPVGKTGAAGVDGAPGAPGQNGTDGISVTGADGPSGPPGPVGAAGADGATGAPGADGRDGVSVTSVTCVPSDTGTAFRFALSDGSTQDVAGECALPIPSTDPTPDPSPAG